MAEYLFVLGRTSELCQAEAENVLTREKITYNLVFSSSKILHISSSPVDANYLIRTLGGTIKIAEVEEVVEKAKNILVDKFTTLIQRGSREKNQKITFGISAYGNFHFNELIHYSKGVKKNLEEAGFNVRFVLPKEETALSSVVVKKQKIFEIIVVDEGEKLVLGKTLVVQDFEDWGKRDFGRPAPAPHQGMLPPKVARMMVNLAISNFQAPSSNITILDPFCGTGTILAEGMMLELNVIGSDQSEEAVEKTKKNLEWLSSQYQVSSIKYKVLQIDATYVSEKIPAKSIDAIVTEPYLGPLFETEKQKNLKTEKLKNIILGLEKLYIGCLREWYKILKPQGTIVIALPSFRIDKGEFFVKKPIDTRENLGYTVVAGPYQYSRPQAVVIRNIYILEKK